jgi:hypothetical protein
MITGTPTENTVSITVVKSELKVKELGVREVVTVNEDKPISAAGTSGRLVSRVTALDSINSSSPRNHVLYLNPILLFVRFVVG